MRQHIFVFGVAYRKFTAYRRHLRTGRLIQKAKVLMKINPRRNFAAVVNIAAYKVRLYRKAPFYVHARPGHNRQKHRLRFALRQRIGYNRAAYYNTFNRFYIRTGKHSIQRVQNTAQHLAVRRRLFGLRINRAVIYQNGVGKSAANIYT